jgi:hypothetical protein
MYKLSKLLIYYSKIREEIDLEACGTDETRALNLHDTFVGRTVAFVSSSW